MERKCNDCRQVKGAEEFNAGRGACKACRAAKRREKRLYPVDPSVDSISAASRWANGGGESRRGVSARLYARMLENQGGLCAVCGNGNNGRSLCVDHCHQTGAVRGLLCHKCNWALGYVGDDPKILAGLTSYLRRHRGVTRVVTSAA